MGALPAGSIEGTEIGSLAPEGVSAAADTATHTRPERSAAIAVTSGFAESKTVVTCPALSIRSTRPEPEVPAQSRPSASTKSARTCGSVVA